MEFASLFFEFKEHLFVWQTLAGSLIGASAPLLILWLSEKNKERKEIDEYLYYLQRIIVDQINSVLEIDEVATKFLELKLGKLIKNIESNPTSAYSIDTIFFPLFSVRAIPHDVNTKSSGSGYIDNKVAKIYAMSNDLPHIIQDIRLQLQDTLEKNEKIAFGKLNSPEVQKEQYKRNIQEYEKMIKEELLLQSIPRYLKKLAETLVAVEEKTRRYSFVWRMRFDPRWRFYTTKVEYIQARSKIMESLDAYFLDATNKKIQEINSQKVASEK